MKVTYWPNGSNHLNNQKNKQRTSIFLRYLVFLGFVLSLLSACSQPQLNPLPYDAKILAFGDSLTAGKGVDKSFSYPSVLAQLIEVDVINAGISGETTAQGLRRLPQALSTHQPDLLILLEGGNDILQNKDLDQTKRNLSDMISLAKQQGIQVMLVAVPEKSLFSSSASFYHELSDEHQLVLEDGIIAELMRSPEMKSDPVHFNEAGYRALAQRIAELMQQQNII
ncbi:arylesterase [Thalassotalea aquiviva]|uniref:arylesterase n=1 Tax=Thalassotalea aquiviva TaxID=3242415 RepID=UPI00352ADE79